LQNLSPFLAKIHALSPIFVMESRLKQQKYEQSIGYYPKNLNSNE